MLISIVTPTYNSERFILETYQSIHNQTYSDWEWLVTDDCSTDSTVEILEHISQQDPRVRLFKNENNSGAAVTRNVSLSHANGDFIAFIDSDDIWEPSKLTEQLNFMGDFIHFSFTQFTPVDSEMNSLSSPVDSRLEKKYFTYSDMLKKEATLGCSTVMIRACVFDDIHMPLIRTGQDYALWLKLLKTGHNAFLFKRSFTNYRILPNSISRNKFKKALRQWSIYREIEGLSLLFASVCFIHYAWRAIFRK